MKKVLFSLILSAFCATSVSAQTEVVPIKCGNLELGLMANDLQYVSDSLFVYNGSKSKMVVLFEGKPITKVGTFSDRKLLGLFGCSKGLGALVRMPDEYNMLQIIIWEPQLIIARDGTCSFNFELLENIKPKDCKDLEEKCIKFFGFSALEMEGILREIDMTNM